MSAGCIVSSQYCAMIYWYIILSKITVFGDSDIEESLNRKCVIACVNKYGGAYKKVNYFGNTN